MPIQAAINHQEVDRVPHDLAAYVVTGISPKAFLRAMEYKGFGKIGFYGAGGIRLKNLADFSVALIRLAMEE